MEKLELYTVGWNVKWCSLWKTACVPLPQPRETWMEFQTPDFGLVHPWLSLALGKCPLSLFQIHKNKHKYKETLLMRTCVKGEAVGLSQQPWDL